MNLVADVEVHRGGWDLRAAVEVADGEVVAVVGPNGAGKSTLLQAIAGLVPIAAGTVTLHGERLSDGSRRRQVWERDLGVVFADPLLLPHLTLRDNVAFGVRTRGRRTKDARAVAMEWLERVGLADVADQRPAMVSTGQAQRAALARALAPQPAALLLDEPLASVDVEGRDDLRSLLRQHLAAFGGPCLLVTHDPLEALLLGDRLAVCEDGRITQTGTVADVTSRPRSTWAARLAGANLLRGHADGGAVIVGTVRIAAATSHSGDVFALIRPSAIALHRQRPEGSPRNVLPVAVRAVELAGARVRIRLAGPLPLVAEVTPAALAALQLAPGTQVWAAIKATEVETYPA